MKSTKCNCHLSRGFTLIEMMIVVAIIGILAAVAYPSYIEHIRKSRRVDAKNALLDFASRQERYFSTHNNYATSPNLLGYAPIAYPVDIVTGGQPYYRLDGAVGSTGVSYQATATPIGAQSADSCGVYSLNQLGVQGNTPAKADCW